MKEYAIAACLFWASRQSKDGSFDEYMPNEKSHVATSFSSLAVATAYHMLRIQNKIVLTALEKACDWLSHNEDTVVINHDAGCVPLFYLIYLITKKKKYLHMCRKKLKIVLSNLHQEGWFNEYGGADIGYQSYSIYFLAKYFTLSGDRTVLSPLNQAVGFFKYFIHPDLSVGGIYGSRDTDFIIPTGFEMLMETVPYATEIAIALRKAVVEMKIVGPYSFDDRFLSEELYTFLEHLGKPSTPKKELPSQGKGFVKYFKECGLYVRKHNDWYCVLNFKKGGIGKVFHGKKIDLDFSGWAFKDKENVYSTYGPSVASLSKNEVTIQGNFNIYRFRQLGLLTSICIKILCLFGLGAQLKKAMRYSLIKQVKRSDIKYERMIEFRETGPVMRDQFSQDISARLMKTTDFSPIYSTSVHLYKE
ncbi:hypothetical protein COT47_07335 [Candidatus Woesearchaeota archaeon CG08_land_8_20_14_0_20_43_7]|nr:MAG: hypothetical protein COT47_07335 [Candidatus Woesearchaeota archaeon CG08_land_8_20_14_0_20_43_7]